MENCTSSLTSIWFALAGVISFILSLLGMPVHLQIIVFFVASAVLVLSTRPLVKKFLAKEKQKTNFDRIIGQKALVIEDIDAVKGNGQIKINGAVWSARAEEFIKKDELVLIKEIKGVHAIVEKEEN